MKIFLIRVGKALKAIRREGLILGGKRVARAFFALFRFVGSGDILFVTGGVGDSARYRTHNVSEELEMKDFKCSITVQDNPLLPSYVDKFSIFVFHRVLFTPSIAKFIEQIKYQGKEIIFEIDDLVYDPKYLEHMHYYKIMNSFEKKLYENGVGGEILADPYVKVATTTTDFLASKLQEAGKKVIVVPNRLSKKDIETAWEMEDDLENIKDKETIKIGYFSGAPSHNKDFETITKVLFAIMEKYPNVELFLAGPLDILNDLNKFSDRIKQFPYVERYKHFKNLASVDINIAPLEIDNPFCESKSELKFFEAGIVGVPTVAAATEPFRKAIEDGVDGFIANGDEEWTEKLEKLIVDEDFRIAMGEKAKEKSLEKYSTIKADNQEYYKYLRSKIKK